MDLSSIYEGLRKNLEEMKPEKDELEKLVGNYRKIVEENQMKLDEAEAKLKDICDKEFAIRNAMDSLELIDIKDSDQHTEEKTDHKALEGMKIVRQPIKQPVWTREKAKLVRYNRYDQEIDNFSTQAAAARALNWDQSSISRFLKFDKEAQLRKKNFYFMWQH